MENFLNVFFPPKCLFCTSVGEVFCESCLRKAPLLLEEIILFRRVPVFACFRYEGVVRNCIRYAKYSSRQFAALQALARFGVTKAMQKRRSYVGFVVCPVPLSVTKMHQRGFNQARIIAKIVAHAFGLSMHESSLVRVVDTKAQYLLDKSLRRQNLQGAFAVPCDISGAKILLVDDICTSGTTFTEAVRTLYRCGAKEVACFALSKKV